jgi:hypothetical protein
VPWSEETFAKLSVASPEPLTSSFAVSHSLLLNVLDRPAGGLAALKRLLTDNHEPRKEQRRHIRRAVAIARSLLSGGIIERVVGADGTVDFRVAADLQRDFSLNQPLSPFVLEALTHLDEDEPTHALDVLSMVEASLEDPGTVIAAQLWKRKTEVIDELKAAGVEYEERMAVLDTVEHPKPLRDLTYELFDAYRARHPWVADHNVRPKAVARDLYERAMSFAQYVDHYGLARSEGLLLRYLTDAYKAMVQNVPEDAKTDEVYDLTEWLGEVVRQVDSSLLDEWEQLRAGVEPAAVELRLPEAPPRLTANARAFRTMVRNELFHLVELAARRAHGDLGELTGWTWEAWAAALAPYWERHGAIGPGPTPGGRSSSRSRRARDLARATGPRRSRRRPRLGHPRRRRPRRVRRGRRAGGGGAGADRRGGGAGLSARAAPPGGQGRLRPFTSLWICFQRLRSAAAASGSTERSAHATSRFSFW